MVDNQLTCKKLPRTQEIDCGETQYKNVSVI